MRGRCLGAAGPGAEVCDGKDNNCDGATDEGNPGGGAACGSGRPGICAEGTRVCAGGSLACRPNVSPAMETCNGLDDSCDGQVDEGFTWRDGANNAVPLGADCKGGVGACASTGKVACSGPGAAECRPAAGSPVLELRDRPAANGSFDWDCNGRETPEFDGSTYFFPGQGSCDSVMTFRNMCDIFSPGACNNPSGFTLFFTYSCTDRVAACGDRVVRFRCQYRAATGRCAYDHIQAANEASPTGFYIPATNRCR